MQLHTTTHARHLFNTHPVQVSRPWGAPLRADSAQTPPNSSPRFNVHCKNQLKPHQSSAPPTAQMLWLPVLLRTGSSVLPPLPTPREHSPPRRWSPSAETAGNTRPMRQPGQGAPERRCVWRSDVSTEAGAEPLPPACPCPPHRRLLPLPPTAPREMPGEDKSRTEKPGGQS